MGDFFPQTPLWPFSIGLLLTYFYAPSKPTRANDVRLTSKYRLQPSLPTSFRETAKLPSLLLLQPSFRQFPLFRPQIWFHKKTPLPRGGVFPNTYSGIVQPLHGFRAPVPVRTRPTAASSARNFKFAQNRHIPLHNFTPLCSDKSKQSIHPQ